MASQDIAIRDACGPRIPAARHRSYEHLVRNLEVVKGMYQAGLIEEEEAREFVKQTVKELKKINRKCLGFVPCGKDRKIWNMFGLI